MGLKWEREGQKRAQERVQRVGKQRAQETPCLYSIDSPAKISLLLWYLHGNGLHTRSCLSLAYINQLTQTHTLYKPHTLDFSSELLSCLLKQGDIHLSISSSYTDGFLFQVPSGRHSWLSDWLLNNALIYYFLSVLCDIFSGCMDETNKWQKILPGWIRINQGRKSAIEPIWNTPHL